MRRKDNEKRQFNKLCIKSIIRCQQILAEWINPESRTTDIDCIYSILSIIDSQSFCEAQSKFTKKSSNKIKQLNK